VGAAEMRSHFVKASSAPAAARPVNGQTMAREGSGYESHGAIEGGRARGVLSFSPPMAQVISIISTQVSDVLSSTAMA
jgi:hypothetical protein